MTAFEQANGQLLPGDRVALYRDEVELISRGEFGPGVEGLAALLAVRIGRSPQELIDSAMSLAKPELKLVDDLTMPLIEVR